MKGLDKFENLVEAFSSLPSIGKKSAIKLAYFCVMKDPLVGSKLAFSIEEGLKFLRPCLLCGGLSQDETCLICSDESRDKDLLCLVEDAKNIIVLEEAASYNGLYFVYDDSKNALEKLNEMINHFDTKELIFAFTHSINTDSLIFYIEEKLKNKNLKFSKIAQGIPSGVALENVDMMSLLKALAYRVRLD